MNYCQGYCQTDSLTLEMTTPPPKLMYKLSDTPLTNSLKTDSYLHTKSLVT